MRAKVFIKELFIDRSFKYNFQDGEHRLFYQILKLVEERSTRVMLSRFFTRRCSEVDEQSSFADSKGPRYK